MGRQGATKPLIQHRKACAGGDVFHREREREKEREREREREREMREWEERR